MTEPDGARRPDYRHTSSNSPTEQSSASQIAAKVENRIARARSFFRVKSLDSPD